MPATDSEEGRRRRADHIRVVVVDDHAAVREALASAISNSLGMEVCGEAASVVEALPLIEQILPDVAVVDISLQDSHGLELVQVLHSRFPEVHVVVYSMHDEHVYAERAFNAGACGYIMKSEPTPRVIDAIRRASQGHLSLNPSLALPGQKRAGIQNAADLDFAVDELTTRERAVFERLGRGSTIEEIAEELDMEVRTADTHRRRIKEKLGLNSIVELMQFAIRWHSAR